MWQLAIQHGSGPDAAVGSTALERVRCGSWFYSTGAGQMRQLVLQHWSGSDVAVSDTANGGSDVAVMDTALEWNTCGS
jgi:hypothetical protein